jgi:hypothetical protein
MHVVESFPEEKRASLPSEIGRMMIYKLNIGEKAKIYVYNHYIYMQRCYLPKKLRRMEEKRVE